MWDVRYAFITDATSQLILLLPLQESPDRDQDLPCEMKGRIGTFDGL